jgi:hypothetical protein
MRKKLSRLREFGLTSVWKSRDREETLPHNKELWEEWKKDHGYSDRIPVKQIPGFLESIEQLSIYGYSYTDIGVMFGLCRERIRQYFREYGLQTNETRGAMYRIWDDEKNCFVPIATKDLQERLKETLREKREKQKEEDRETRKQIHIQAIQDFFGEHRRTPSLAELGKKLGRKQKTVMPHLAYEWGYDYTHPEKISPKEAIDNLYAAAGVEKRIDGRSL